MTCVTALYEWFNQCTKKDTFTDAYSGLTFSNFGVFQHSSISRLILLRSSAVDTWIVPKDPQLFNRKLQDLTVGSLQQHEVARKMS